MNNQQNTQKLALKRDTYKALKRMDREQLSEYITNIYVKGYEAGKKAATPTGLMDAIRSTLLNVADIGPTRADAIMKHLADVLGGGEQKKTPVAANNESKKEATADKDDELPAPPPPVIDAGQFHGSTPPADEGQKHQIVRGKVSGTGWPIDGHALIFEIEKDGDVYYLNNWADADDEAVMETMRLNDPLYQNTPIEEFRELWKNQEWEPEGRFFLTDDKVEVVEVIKTWDD